MRKVLAALGIALIVWSCIALYQIPDDQQVVSEARLSEDGTLPQEEISCAVCAINPSAVFASGEQQTDGMLYAVNEEYMRMYPVYLISGRLPYKEELDNGEKVCVMEERTAIALFRVGEPLDMELTENGQEYRVIGVVRNATDIGSPRGNRVYVPYTGAKSQFETVISAAKSFDDVPQGRLISIKKERMRQTLLLRVTISLIGILLIARFFRFYRGKCRAVHASWRDAIRDDYAKDIFPRFLPRWLLLAAGAAIQLLGIFLILQLLVEPAYTLPEWVPEVLVSASSIKNMFYRNIQANSPAVLLRTQELLRVEHWGYCLNVGCILVLLSMGRLKQWKKKQKNESDA